MLSLRHTIRRLAPSRQVRIGGLALALGLVLAAAFTVSPAQAAQARVHLHKTPHGEGPRIRKVPRHAPEEAEASTAASTAASMTIPMEGQDLGAGVALFFDGASEYEWGWTLRRDQVERLLTALEIAPESPDAAQKLASRLKAVPRAEIADYFRDAGASFWSRHGD